MKKLNLLTLALLSSAALAQSAPPPPASAAEIDTLIQMGLVVIAGYLVRPVTAIFQSWKVTAQVDARVIALALSLLLTGITGYASGLYGSGLHGALVAIAAAAIAFIRSYGANKAASITVQGATKKVLEGQGPPSDPDGGDEDKPAKAGRTIWAG